MCKASQTHIIPSLICMEQPPHCTISQGLAYCVDCSLSCASCSFPFQTLSFSLFPASPLCNPFLSLCIPQIKGTNFQNQRHCSRVSTGQSSLWGCVFCPVKTHQPPGVVKRMLRVQVTPAVYTKGKTVRLKGSLLAKPAVERFYNVTVQPTLKPVRLFVPFRCLNHT